jgi:arylsulfatase A-like enzyme/HEAT repeat protein
LSSLLPNLLAASLALACCEIGWVLVRANSLFLSLGERLLYALACLGLSTFFVLVLGLLLASAGSRRWLRALLALTAGAGSAWAGWLLTAGRRVHDLPGRPYAVAGGAVLVALFVYKLQAWRGSSRLAWLAWPAAFALLCVDALILPRGYPPFHLALALSAVFVMSFAALRAPALRLRSAPWLAAGVLLVGGFALVRLAAHPTAGFAVREKAPWSARFARLLEPGRRARQTRASVPLAARAGVDLRDRDVLLITVDALRADLLHAYGGARGVTPTLDALANESARFTRAYTPAPHTSYALASLLTGKFVKPLVELGQPLGDPQTVPDRLRRYGYRTAAFYPPAIFFVDGANFSALAERGFGFEYRKEMFASAADRVGQLDDYLREADPKRPLFVWVHLFEPHEPYDPPADLVHDGSERGRYEAEVRAADRAIAPLIAHFREARPRATVIVTADHGEEFGDHGGSFHGSSLYDEQVRVPLLWSSPGAVTPRQIDAPVELTDVGATILSTAGVPRDAHMRGDDLGAALLGEPGPRFAFASIDARHMLTDGSYKLICGARELHCALFDLVHDPAELHNVGVAEPARVAALRGELDGFLASITHNEAVAVSAGVGLPDALARAKLGSALPLAELLPSLVDARASVRAEAARVLASMGDPAALPALDKARNFDDDADVRAEAAIAALALGDASAVAAVGAIEQPPGRQRRAALALAHAKQESAVPVLAALLADESASEEERLSALRALRELGSAAGVEPAIGALANVRLCEQAARTLGALGGERARNALREQLGSERYPPARRAEAEALRALADPQLPALVRHFLGMQSSLPDGVELLAELGALTPSSRTGALLLDPAVRAGAWQCTERACTALGEARLQLPARGAPAQAPVRITLWVEPSAAGTLSIDGEIFPVQASDSQLSWVRAKQPRRLVVSGQVPLRALVVTSARAEIPPPPPEPWDASVPVR